MLHLQTVVLSCDWIEFHAVFGGSSDQVCSAGGPVSSVCSETANAGRSYKLITSGG